MWNIHALFSMMVTIRLWVNQHYQHKYSPYTFSCSFLLELNEFMNEISISLSWNECWIIGNPPFCLAVCGLPSPLILWASTDFEWISRDVIDCYLLWREIILMKGFFLMQVGIRLQKFYSFFSMAICSVITLLFVVILGCTCSFSVFLSVIKTKVTFMYVYVVKCVLI